MDYYARFELTKNEEYYFDNVNPFQSFMEDYIDSVCDIVTTILTAPESNIYDINHWKFEVSQNNYPSWTFEGDSSLEERTRKYFVKIIEEQKIGHEQIVGDYKTANVGILGIAISGSYGKSISGNYGVATSGLRGSAYCGAFGVATTGDYGSSTVESSGTARSGNNGVSVTGPYGTAISGDYGKATTENCGIAITSNYGFSIAGKYGTAITRENGTAIVGVYGKAKAGINGLLSFQYYDEDISRLRMVTAYVGENGIEPDTFYTVRLGKLIKCEEKKQFTIKSNDFYKVKTRKLIEEKE
jgi:hypothetical protein